MVVSPLESCMDWGFRYAASADIVSALQDGFTSLPEELPQPIARSLRGELPRWLRGDLYEPDRAALRSASAAIITGSDGLAMLHRFSISGAGVSYSNRFLQSAAYRTAEKQGVIGYREFATDPCVSLFGRLRALFVAPKLTDNANVSVQALDGKVAALTETTSPVIFDPDTLETLGVFGFDARPDGQMTCAHPHYDFARHCQYSLC